MGEEEGIKMQLKGRVGRKPNLKPRMTMARMKFYTDHLHWMPNDWMKVMFSDKSSFPVVRCKHMKVRRPPCTRFDPRFITSMVKPPECDGVGRFQRSWRKGWAILSAEGDHEADQLTGVPRGEDDPQVQGPEP